MILFLFFIFEYYYFFPTLPMLIAVIPQISQRTVFELILCLSEQVTFIPGQRQRLCAPLLFKVLTQQPTIEAYSFDLLTNIPTGSQPLNRIFL